MAKTKIKTAWFCTACGADSPKWAGRCPACGEWGTLVEERVSTPASAATGSNAADTITAMLRQDARVLSTT